MAIEAIAEADRTLDRVRLLDGLPPAALRTVEARCRWLTLAPDQRALDGDGEVDEIYFVVSGKVRVINHLGDGTEVQLAELAAGECFGELSAIDSKARSAEVIGSQACTLAALPAQDFRQVLLEWPEVALRLIDQLAGVVRAMNTRVTAIASQSPRQRVFAELLRLAQPGPAGDGIWVIDRAPSHDELASASSTEKQDVAMAIGILARDGILERRHRSLVVRDQARLCLMANP